MKIQLQYIRYMHISYPCATHRLRSETLWEVWKNWSSIAASTLSLIGRRLKIAPPLLLITTTVTGFLVILQRQQVTKQLAWQHFLMEVQWRKNNRKKLRWILGCTYFCVSHKIRLFRNILIYFLCAWWDWNA